MAKERSFLMRAVEAWSQIKSHRGTSCVIAIFAVIGMIGDASVAGEWLLTMILFLFSRPAAAIVVLFGLLYVFQDSLLPLYHRVSLRAKQTWVGTPPFRVRPICGETLSWSHDPELLVKQDITARLAIRNTSRKLLRQCSVRLEGAFMLRYGHVCSSPQEHPSISNERGESFYLRWAGSESASKDRKNLDIPSDGSDHIVEVLVLNVPKRGTDFAAANPDDLQNKLRGIGGPGWWKLHIKIASTDGSVLNTEWVAACADRDPGPITLHGWRPRGEQILEEQQKELKKRKEEKQQRRVRGPT